MTKGQFSIGALVVAVGENAPETRGRNLNGDLVRYGNGGTIIEGPCPWNFKSSPMNYWRVQWRDGRTTWSGEGFLQVIGDVETLAVKSEATEVA